MLSYVRGNHQSFASERVFQWISILNFGILLLISVSLGVSSLVLITVAGCMCVYLSEYIIGLWCDLFFFCVEIFEFDHFACLLACYILYLLFHGSPLFHAFLYIVAQFFVLFSVIILYMTCASNFSPAIYIFHCV